MARFQRGHPRLLLRVSPSETRAENNIPIYKFPETTIGITQCIFFGDENKTSIIHKSHSVSHGYYSVRLLRRHNVNSNKTTNQIDPYPKTIYVPIPYPQVCQLYTPIALRLILYALVNSTPPLPTSPPQENRLLYTSHPDTPSADATVSDNIP